MEEKRKNKRLDLEVSIQLERLIEADITTVKMVHVEVTDISKTGIGFKSSQELSIGTYYDTKIQIWTKETVDAVIEIIRRDEDADGMYHYGCSFIGLTDTDALKIEIYQLFKEV